MLVHYFSHAGSETGPGRAARDWIDALNLAGVEVCEFSLADLAAERVELAIYHGSPAQLSAIEFDPSDGVKRVAATTWETSRLPSNFSIGLNRYHEVVTPSEFCHDVLVDAMGGMFPAVRVVPHCFDPAVWEPSARPDLEQPFTFYTVGGWGERKNVLGVLRAYLHEFTRDDKTRLVIISQGADFHVIHSVLARSSISPTKWPGLSIPDRELSAEEIIRLHRDADCFVLTTRGEGWGLGMFEALIMQRPVVAPVKGGQVDFLSGFEDAERQWFTVPALQTPVFAGEGEVELRDGIMSGKIRLPNGADARQLWFEPDLSETARQMRFVYEKFKNSRDYSCYENNRQLLEDRYSAPVVGSTFSSALREISGS